MTNIPLGWRLWLGIAVAAALQITITAAVFVTLY